MVILAKVGLHVLQEIQMANETEIKKPADKEADDLFKALCLGTLRDDTRLDGNHRRPRW